MPTKPRRAGLSRHTGFDGPLLRTIGNRISGVEKVKQPSPDIDAPPLSSDEDEPQLPTVQTAKLATSRLHSGVPNEKRALRNVIEDVTLSRKRALDDMSAFNPLNSSQRKRTKYTYSSNHSKAKYGWKSRIAMTAISPNALRESRSLSKEQDEPHTSSGTTADLPVWEKLEWNEEDENYKRYKERSNILDADTSDDASDTSSDSILKSPKTVKSSEVPKCPMCQMPVNRNFLESFERGRIMKIEAQIRFCKAHKKFSAREEWKMKRYPVIDWDNIHIRVQRNLIHIKDVLHKRVTSIFRETLEQRFRKGRKSARLSMGEDLDDLIPGYYGSKGSRIMADVIIDHFQADLRTLAPKDKIIASMGASSYVQAVLVPEMALVLIKHDMCLEDTDALKILKDSREVGELLNEAEDDNMLDVIAKKGRR